MQVQLRRPPIDLGFPGRLLATHRHYPSNPAVLLSRHQRLHDPDCLSIAHGANEPAFSILRSPDGTNCSQWRMTGNSDVTRLVQVCRHPCRSLSRENTNLLTRARESAHGKPDTEFAA